MNYKLLKRLKWLIRYFGKEYNDPRVILIAVDRDADEERTPITTHHNMCCRGHYIMTLVELLRSEVNELRGENPEAADDLEEIIKEMPHDRTLH